MSQVRLGETRWRMLRMALKMETFCYHDLRIPSRADQRHFDALYDLGLFAVAPAGSYTTRVNEFKVKTGDPIGIFVVTEKGREAADLGECESVPEADPLPSAALDRKPATGEWKHAAAPKPPVAGKLFHGAPAVPPAIQAIQAAPTADDYSNVLVPVPKQAPAPPGRAAKKPKAAKPKTKKRTASR